MSNNKEMDLDKIFSGIEDHFEVETYANDRFIGFAVKWQEKDHGFGELTFSYDKQEGQWNADTECMGLATLTRILEKAAPVLALRMLEYDKHSKHNK